MLNFRIFLHEKKTMRNDNIDFVKGIGILLMIVGHCSYWKEMVGYISSFHMPLFFIVSGYFYKNSFNLSKNIKKTLKPTIIITLLCCAIYLMANNIDLATKRLLGLCFPDSFYLKEYSWINLGATWFIPALFWCKLISHYVVRLSNGKYILVSAVISSVCAFLGGSILDYNIPFGILIGGCGVFSYCLGYYARIHDSMNKCIPTELWIVFFAIWLFFCHYYQFGMFLFQYTRFFPLQILIAFGMTLFIYRVSVGIENVDSNLISKLASSVSFCGSRTLWILCSHEMCKVSFVAFNLYDLFGEKNGSLVLFSASIIMGIISKSLHDFLSEKLITKN